MKKRVLAMLLAAALIVSLFAACGGGGNTSSTASTADNTSSAADNTSTDDSTPAATGVKGGDFSEHVEATVYENYDWFSPKEWGADAASKYMQETFNIDLLWSKPDADAAARLNIMLSGNDLPESIVLTAGTDTIKVAQTGKLVDLETLDWDTDIGNELKEILPEATLNLMKVDGVFYGIPNWPHAHATGGNYGWMVNTRIWEEVGSPDIKTLDDLHDYAVAVKEAGLTSYSGTSVLPAILGQDSNGFYAIKAFNHSLGGRNIVGSTYYTYENAKVELGFENEIYVNALKLANQWYREGLLSSDNWTDNADTFLEKVTNGRVGLLWYDFSQDDTNNFRRIIREQTGNAESYEVIGTEYFMPDSSIYPPADGVEIVYGDECTTPGWQNFCVTTSATDVEKQRLFDLFAWMLGEDGAINMMYGPEGGLWEGKTDDGLPQLKKPQDELTSTELDAAGAWFWASPAGSDAVDNTKFAVNDLFPEEKRNWGVAIQAHTFSYDYDRPMQGQKFTSDNLFGYNNAIDPQSDLGVNQQLIADQCAAEQPKIIMAADDATFDSLLQGLIDYCHANGVDDIIAEYQKAIDNNIALQGGDPYDNPNLYVHNNMND